MSEDPKVKYVVGGIAGATVLLFSYAIYDEATPPRNERLTAYATEHYAQTLATHGLRAATYSDHIQTSEISIEDASGSHVVCDVGCPRGVGRSFELKVAQDGRVEVRTKIDMENVAFESAKAQFDGAVAIVLDEYTSYQQRAASWQVPAGPTATQTTSSQ